MVKHRRFVEDCNNEIAEQGRNAEINSVSSEWMTQSAKLKYSYHFSWMGRPIIQYPQDIVALQEIIFNIKPDLIIETGIAHGGSLIFSASMLELNAVCGGPLESIVLGIDIDIREHNREAIEAHPLSRRIKMLQGSSIDPLIVEQVSKVAAGRSNVLVCLDSNHTHDHVLSELQAYAPLVTLRSYCVVFDTIVDDLPDSLFPDRPWGRESNPKTAVREFMRSHPEFVIDDQMDAKLLISAAPSGYLKRIS